LERSAGKSHAIILGDFNMRDTDKGYAQVAAEYTNAWVSIYPTKISADGIDMSGSNRIDHIFFSHDLSATSATYLLPPASASDHPVHWAEITWQK
jgi:endonuclease/exonuclease/phosphatase family metal-dependent hydrolase